MPDPRPLPTSLATDAWDERVGELLRRQLPSFWRERPIDPALRLDDAGLGFDSVGLLELLLACERELGVTLPADLLLDDAMTVGDLSAKLRRAVRAS